MGDEFDKNLCNEKHGTVNKRLDEAEGNMKELVKNINGKFTKVFVMFIGILLSIIASLVVTIVTRS